MALRVHHRVRAGLRSFFRRHTVEHELDEELQFHFQQMEAHRSAAGGAPPLPRRRAGLDQLKEACRDMRTLRPFEHLLHDARFGARLLVRSPIFTIVAVLSLALGIGANSAIFSLINAIVLRPLPVDRPGQLRIAQVVRPDGLDRRFSYPAYEAARQMLAGRAEVAAVSSGLVSMQIAAAGTGDATPRPQAGHVQLVSGDYFGLLRQPPQVGRLLGPEDDRTLGGHPVAVLSDGYWTRRFGRASNIVGRELIVNGTPFTVVGVTAPEFLGTSIGSRPVDVWLPLMMQATVRFSGNMSSRNGDTRKPWPPQREVSWLTLILRVRDDGVPAATEAMGLVMQRDYALRSGYQENAELRQEYQASRVVLVDGSRGLSGVRDDMATPLLVLFAMVGFLLAIACANIASLLLARATSRQREMAIRLSIGAGRARLIRQLLTESLLLSLIGGGLGLLAAVWGSTTLLTLANRGTPLTALDVTPDWRVIGFTLIVSLLTGLLFGLLPAFRGTHVRLAETLKAQTRGAIGTADGGGRRAFLGGRLLIAGQLAFSLLLLIVAALFARSLQELMRVDVGFDRDRLLAARLDVRAGGYAPAELPELYRRVVDRLAAIPGVTGASMSANGLFARSISSSGFEAEGYTHGREERLTTRNEIVTPDYFRTVGLTILQGRPFGPEDVAGGRKVSVINETMARRYFRDRNPIGKRWSYGQDFDDNAFEIIGVVEDARYDALKEGEVNMAYRPAIQTDEYLASIEIRTAGPPAALATEVRNVLRRAEPRLPVISIEPIGNRVARATDQERLMTRLTMVFGGVALFLACLGLYGTISYAVTRRTAEIGVRMALGADRRAVQWLILREALGLVGVGLLVGVPLAFAAARAMATLFYHVTPADPVAHGVAVTALVAIAAAAAWLPARRAARVDPMRALRTD